MPMSSVHISMVRCGVNGVGALVGGLCSDHARSDTIWNRFLDNSWKWMYNATNMNSTHTAHCTYCLRHSPPWFASRMPHAVAWPSTRLRAQQTGSPLAQSVRMSADAGRVADAIAMDHLGGFLGIALPPDEFLSISVFFVNTSSHSYVL